MSILDTALDRTLRRDKQAGKHRAARSLRDENVMLLNRQAAADDFFALLTDDRDQVYACWRKAAADRDAAEQLAACLAEENERLHAQLAPFLAAVANEHKVDVPPMVRDTSALEDQATGPIPILTIPVPLGLSPLAAVTDPGRTGQTSWGMRNQQAGVA